MIALPTPSIQQPITQWEPAGCLTGCRRPTMGPSARAKLLCFEANAQLCAQCQKSERPELTWIAISLLDSLALAAPDMVGDKALQVQVDHLLMVVQHLSMVIEGLANIARTTLGRNGSVGSWEMS